MENAKGGKGGDGEKCSGRKMRRKWRKRWRMRKRWRKGSALVFVIAAYKNVVLKRLPGDWDDNVPRIGEHDCPFKKFVRWNHVKN